MYSEQQGQGGEATAEGGAEETSDSPENDAVDAEFEEVKDDK